MTSIDRLSQTARNEPAHAAVATWRKVLEVDPVNPEALYSLAECLAATGKNSEAVLYLKRLGGVSEALAKKLEHRFILGSYAMCDIAARFLEDGLTEEARNNYEQAQVLMPKNVDCRVGLGRIALLENNFDLAESYFQSGLSIEENNLFALLGMGDVLLESKPELAINFFTRAIESSPNEPYGYYQRASAYETLGKVTEASVDWERVKRLEMNGI